MPDKILSVMQAAAYLGSNANTLAKWRREGVGPPYILNPGAQPWPYYRLSDLDRYLDEMTVQPYKVPPRLLTDAEWDYVVTHCRPRISQWHPKALDSSHRSKLNRILNSRRTFLMPLHTLNPAGWVIQALTLLSVYPHFPFRLELRHTLVRTDTPARCTLNLRVEALKPEIQTEKTPTVRIKIRRPKKPNPKYD